jgi:TPR repeat protein
MQTDRTTKALVGIIVFLSLGSLQAGMALQGPCRAFLLEGCRALAEQGDADAQAMLGVMYDTGEGVPEDDAEAVRWYRLAAAQGDAEAQLALGFMYAKGAGVPENDAEAVRWFRMAAEQGVGFAQFTLGLRYENGEGVVQNDARAYLWFNLAAAASQSQGADRARRVEARDLVAAKLSPAGREAAQRLATQCQASDFQDCGEPE